MTPAEQTAIDDAVLHAAVTAWLRKAEEAARLDAEYCVPDARDKAERAGVGVMPEVDDEEAA